MSSNVLDAGMLDNNAKVFVYMGEHNFDAVYDEPVAHVRVDPSVLVIPVNAFSGVPLETIELHENLHEIGDWAFQYRRELKEIVFPSCLREIGCYAFDGCWSLKQVHVPDLVASIGVYAFHECSSFTKFRSPPLITAFSNNMLDYCTRMFSMEVPKNIIEIDDTACHNCQSLRNVALAATTEVDESAFSKCFDLLHIFDTKEAMLNALRIRFARLALHSIIYDKSYYPNALEEMRNIINMGENGEVNPTGNQQDCLGMTPLHILACSTVQCLEMYQLMVEKYPGNLIVEDAWGAVPLLYAVWGEAPSEIVQFLINSYKSLFSNHEFDWRVMVIALGRTNAYDVIKNLLDIQQILSPHYNFDWNQILQELNEFSTCSETNYWVQPNTFCFLTRCSIATRINAIGVKHFRDAMTDYWTGDFNDFKVKEWRTETIMKLEYYESEYR